MSPTRRKSAVTVEDPFTIEVGGRNTAWLHGPQAGKVLLRLDLARIYDHDAGCWSFSKRRVDEVLRDLRRRRRYVEVVEVAR